MSGVIVSRHAHPLTQVSQWVRNGKIVGAELQSRIAETVGHAANVRPKLVFHRAAPITGATGGANIPSSTSGSRARWRFAWRSGPYARYVYVQMDLAPQNSGTPTDPYGLLEVRDGTGTPIGKVETHWGNSDGSYLDVPLNIGGATSLLVDPTTQDITLVEVEPDTDYWGAFWDVNYARIVSAAVWEFSLGSDTDNGYPVNAHAIGSPVLVSHRSTPATMARQLWKKGGAHLINWCSDTDAAAPTTSSAQATFEHAIDSSTTVTAATPGWTLDMRKRTTLSRASLGVPVVMKVTATSTAGNTARVRLLDSTGATVLEQTCNQAGEFDYVTAGYLPATLAKYDLHWGGTSDAFTLYSVNVYEYDAAGETITGDALVSIGSFTVTATGTVV